METWVTGEAVFAGRPSLPPDAILRVLLLDTTYADAPSEILAEGEFPNVAEFASRGKPFPFRLRTVIPDRRIQCRIWAHVKTRGNAIHPGDYVTTQSYPVLTYGHPGRVAIELTRVE